MTTNTRAALLAATRRRLIAEGYANLSTRAVAAEAGVPLSQIHYHFGSKKHLVLALLDEENTARLARQEAMYGEEEPLWKRYEQACDFLEDDLSSGYVRVLQEMLAVGYSDPEVRAALRDMMLGWNVVITSVAREAAERFGGLGPFTAQEVSWLVGSAFLGAEALILVESEANAEEVKASLRRVADLIRLAEGE